MYAPALKSITAISSPILTTESANDLTRTSPNFTLNSISIPGTPCGDTQVSKPDDFQASVNLKNISLPFTSHQALFSLSGFALVERPPTRQSVGLLPDLVSTSAICARKDSSQMASRVTSFHLSKYDFFCF